MIEASGRAEIRGSAAELPLPLYKGDNQRVDDTLLVSFRYHIPAAPEAGGPVQISVSEIQAWCVPKPEGAEEEEEEDDGEGEGVVTSGPYVEVSLLE
eukprot:scaffold2561_cov57-Phaeocystis_antarctica.AAC.1